MDVNTKRVRYENRWNRISGTSTSKSEKTALRHHSAPPDTPPVAKNQTLPRLSLLPRSMLLSINVALIDIAGTQVEKKENSGGTDQST